MATHEDFVEYLNLHSQQKETSTRLKELKEKIVPHLKEGRESPKNLPFRLKLQKRMNTIADWKGAFFKYLRRATGSEIQANEKLEKIASKFDQEETEALVVEKNPEYQI